MALSPAQLQRLVDATGVGLQQIQDELGRDGNGGKVRFPRGYLNPISARMTGFLWIGDETLKRNLCYTLIFSDVLRWVLNRTDLYGVARDMVVKNAIAVMGAIAESLTVAAMVELKQPKGKFAGRLSRLVAAGAMDSSLQAELQWLWDARNGIHVHDVAHLEAGRYPVSDANRAIKAAVGLRDKLSTRFI